MVQVPPSSNAMASPQQPAEVVSTDKPQKSKIDSTPPPRRRASQQSIESSGGSVQRGRRAMKEYYLYDSDFRDLERTGAFAASLLAVATGCFGFAVNALIGLALSENLSPALKSEWTNYRNIAIGIGAICFLVSILLTVSGYNRVEELKSQTSHGTETYKPRSRFQIAIYGIIFLVTLAAGILIGSFLLPFGTSVRNIFSEGPSVFCGSSGASATPYRRTKYVWVIPIIISEFEFRDVERKVLAADLVEASHESALQQRPEAVDCLSLTLANLRSARETAFAG